MRKLEDWGERGQCNLAPKCKLSTKATEPTLGLPCTNEAPYDKMKITIMSITVYARPKEIYKDGQRKDFLLFLS